jgi:hypothetical protein
MKRKSKRGTRDEKGTRESGRKEAAGGKEMEKEAGKKVQLR